MNFRMRGSPLALAVAFLLALGAMSCQEDYTSSAIEADSENLGAGPPVGAENPGGIPAGKEQTLSSAKEKESLEASGFRYLREETFSCGGVTNTVEIFLHEKTKCEFVRLPGGWISLDLSWVKSDLVDFENPMNRVLVKSFLISRTECTQEAWDLVGGEDQRSNVGPDIPINGVNWEDCVAWCEKAGFRLPTKAEWIYACRAGKEARFCYGDDDAGFDPYGWCISNCESGVQPVAQKKSNAFGLYDVHGNAGEWCQDLLDRTGKTVESDKAVGSGFDRRLYMGGSHLCIARGCSSDTVSGFRSKIRRPNLGFRPVFSLPDGEK